MSPEQFENLARQGYNRVALTRSVLADLDTPLSVYLKLAATPFSYLFESVQGGERWGRYSIIGLPCQRILEVREKTVAVKVNGKVTDTHEVEDPLKWIEDYQTQYRVYSIEDLPRFAGGLVGYFGYDTIRYIEPRLGKCSKPDPIGAPDILLMVSDEVIVFDNLSGMLHIILQIDPATERAYARGQARLDEIESALKQPIPPTEKKPVTTAITEADFISPENETYYKAAVDKIRQYIIDGDVMQVVPSQRMSIHFEYDPIDLYRALRHLNPSPYLYFVDLGDHQVVGSSPEILVRLEEGMATVRPLAGTRRRGKDAAEDAALEKELLADEKEIAEHLMLIDLGRNDVGRIAQTGSVKVTDQMSIERYSQVMHIVSNVTGKLKPGLKTLDVLRATFPAGTLSGAPKIRAMEIIDEVEPVKRGIYSGAVGYLSWQGNMDVAIAIRTAVVKNNTLHIQAGGGIVYDSIPETEWQETLTKGRALFRAAQMVANGLHPLTQ
ncbi:MAG: anthranilate synthase component I [Gammaproteobacteria bacterium]|nr:anthranilate synthase component I [Gammaproteobacteria bacterium]